MKPTLYCRISIGREKCLIVSKSQSNQSNQIIPNIARNKYFSQTSRSFRVSILSKFGIFLLVNVYYFKLSMKVTFNFLVQFGISSTLTLV